MNLMEEKNKKLPLSQNHAHFKKTIRCQEILTAYPDLFQFISGDRNTQVALVSPSDKIEKNSLVFIHRSQYLEEAKNIPAILVIPESFSLKDTSSFHCLLSTKNVKWAMAQVCSHFFPVQKDCFYELQNSYQKNHNDERREEKTFIHPTALISPLAIVHPKARIGPYAIVGEKAFIQEGSLIGPHTVIGRGAQIGKKTIIHSHVFIAEFCIIEDECEIQPQTSLGSEGYGYATNEKLEHKQIPHYGRVILEKRVSLGSNVSIDRGTFGDTIIGEGTKIDNHIHIGHNVKIGKHCFITAGFISAGSAKIGNRCYIGGRTTINGHITITDDVHLTGLSVVTNSILKKGAYGGSPILMPLKETLKAYPLLSYLPQMRKSIKAILKKIGLDQQ